jgi:hypothetical protein
MNKTKAKTIDGSNDTTVDHYMIFLCSRKEKIKCACVHPNMYMTMQECRNSCVDKHITRAQKRKGNKYSDATP